MSPELKTIMLDLRNYCSGECLSTVPWCFLLSYILLAFHLTERWETCKLVLKARWKGVDTLHPKNLWVAALGLITWHHSLGYYTPLFSIVWYKLQPSVSSHMKPNRFEKFWGSIWFDHQLGISTFHSTKFVFENFFVFCNRLSSFVLRCLILFKSSCGWIIKIHHHPLQADINCTATLHT